MKVITRPTVAALLLLIALTTTIVAQQKRPAPAKPQPRPAAAPVPPPTFDTLIPAESYTIYGEIRGVGQLIASNTFSETLEPLLKLSGPPKEFRTMVKWLNAHTDELMTSRLLVAAWPTSKNLPDAIIAIEFASAEEAAKLAAPLKTVLTSVLPPVAQPASESTGETPKPVAPPKPSYHLQQAGSLILLTPTPLNLRKLKPAGSKLFSDDINFRAARNRFNSESIFVFLDVKLIERLEEERRKQYAQEQLVSMEQAKKELEAAAERAKQTEEALLPEERKEEPATFVPQQRTELVVGASPEPEKETPTPDPVMLALSSIGSSFFEGAPKWPDAVAFALTFENDSFDVRALLINDPGEKSDAVPFMPMLIPGPPIMLESPNILPADTQLFATMSLDLPQIYTTMSRPRPVMNRHTIVTVNDAAFVSPFAELEKKLKLNLKDDLLPLLGSEITLRVPVMGFDLFGLPRGPAPEPVKQDQQGVSASPLLLISVRDKEGVRAFMPKIVEALGFKGASSFAQTERKEDTEIVSYLNFFSYAFVGNFIVLSADPAAVRHVVDSYLKHETLASDVNFKNFTRWQPRPAHGQFYISAALMEGYKTWAEQTTRVTDPTREFLMRMVAEAQPITYSLSNEGFGPLHELHIPKSLVLMALAGISSAGNPTPERQSEALAAGLMHSIAHAQERYKKDKGAGSYGTLEQLMVAEMIPREILESASYKFEVVLTGDKFEVHAVPKEYGKSGKMSYFIDQTMVLRGGDRHGANSSSSDPPVASW